MPWTPLPRIAFAIATYPFNPTTPDDLPLELGDELYIIEQCAEGQWFRGYLVAPPSLLAGLTSVKGQTLEARVFSGIFPAACVDIKEYLATEIPPPVRVEEADEFQEEGEETDDDDVDDSRTEAETEDGGDHDDDNNTINTHGFGNANGYDAHEGGGEGDMIVGGLGVPPRRKANRLSDFGSAGGGGGGSGGAHIINGVRHEDSAPAKTRKEKRNRRRVTNLSRHSQQYRNPNRIRPAAPVPMLKVGDETSSFESEPLIDEIASCLREWYAANIHELLLGRQYPLLDQISTLVQELDLARRQLLHNVLTKAELAATRESTVWALVKGNKFLSREVIVRHPASGRILTGEDSSVELTTLQSHMSLLDAPPVAASEGVTLHHLLLDLKAFVGIATDPTTLVFYLATKNHVPISETFTVELTQQGVPVDQSQIGLLQTLFINLSTRDTAEEIYLVARLYTVHTMVVGVQQNGHGYRDREALVSQNNGGTQQQQQQQMHNSSGVMQPPKSSGNGAKEPKLQGNGSSSRKTKSRDGKSDSETNSSSHGVAPMSQSKKLEYRKALGVGVLDVGRFIRQEIATEQVMRIFVPVGMGGNGTSLVGGHSERGSGGNEKSKTGGGEDWDRLVKDVIESRTSKFEKSPKADRLHFYLRAFNHPDPAQLIKENPTLLHKVNTTEKMGFSGAPTKPRSDIYVTLCNPHLPRHALLLHPKTGSVALPPSSNFNALQISLEVRKPSGERIKDCIFPSSNMPGKTVWKSTVICRDESWNETIKLVLDEDDVPNVHLFMTLSSIPNHAVALAYLPLWNGEAFISDGEHPLLMHRYDESTATPMSTSSGGGGYLTLPWTAGEEGWAAALSLGGAAAGIKVSTYLCSTRFSQDEVLLSLLKWKSLQQPELVAVLKKLVFVPELEIVKLLKEVFDALFGILVDHAGREEIEDLVFIALVTVLGIVYDRRFNLEPIVDEYADKYFNYPFATSCLLRSFTRLLSNPTDPDAAKKLRATFKVGRHIFRFIVVAREKQRGKEAAIGINASQSFAKDLHGIFKLLEGLMRNSAPMLVGTQTLAVQHFHMWLPELVGMLTTEEILLIAIDFMDACAAVKGKLILYKLVLIVNYSRSSLFANPESRRALTVNTVRWLDPHWGKTDEVNMQYREQVRLCCSVLAAQVNELGEEVSEYIPKIIHSYKAIQTTGRHERETFSLLFARTYPFPSRPISGRPIFDEALIELAAILAALSNVPTGLHIDLPEDELAAFLMLDLQVHMSILSCEAFPETWLSMHIYQHKSTMRMLETLAGILVDSFLPDPDDADKFSMELWQAFFSTLLMLVGSDALALETFPEQKRRAVWKIAGDVREQGADLLRRTWEAIGWETSPEDKRRFGLEKMGGYQVQYVPGLVAPIMELCMSVHEGLRSVAVEVLQTMIVSEWTLSQDLSVIQAEMIDSLDRLFKSKSKHFTESITQKLFITELNSLFGPLAIIPNDPLSITVTQLLHTIEEFLDLLVAVHNTPLGEAYTIMDTLRLMEFLKDMRKEDMFIRYVHQLVNVQLEAQNYVEAGLSLQLHADLYPWDFEKKVPALVDPKLPEQTSFERREYLCLQMIKHFEDGKAWDHALEVYRELAHQYEHVVFDFAKLAKAHRAMAKIYENIMSGDVYSPQFFRVAYLGLGFPVGLRDRQFIVQGNYWERIGAFTDRIQQQHPNAKIVSSGEIDDVEGQFIHVTAVTPEHNLFHPVFQRAKVAPHTRDFLLQLRPKSFSHSRPLPGSDGPAGLWLEKTIYTTAESFPTILRRSEIISITQARSSPIENAIDAITKKTQELAGLEKKLSDGKDPNISILSMTLTGAVDSPVNGGVSQYKPLLEPKSADNGEEQKPELVMALRTAILDHVAILKKCLALHARLVQPQLRPMHESMMRLFEKNFAQEIALLTPPAPPPIATSPGQWKHNSSLVTAGNTPINGIVTNGILINSTGGVSAPPNTGEDTVSSLNASAATVAASGLSGSISRGSRITSMIFGNKHHSHHKHKDDDNALTSAVTMSGTTAANTPIDPTPTPSRSSTTKRSRSDGGRRPSTTSSAGGYKPPGSSGSTSRLEGTGMHGGGLVDRVGSVRKRFSMLKLGKKTSKVSVGSGSLAEEE
ncbi:hypothetical protein BDZ91DRAFT_833344 [Kalaharituber pfeilii]|nr:hypothetical protein BDZ91DRAFT_833344 [Kalaharituber pfeilii]